MAERLEEILSRLLVPDNAVIQEATQQLKNDFKDPQMIPALCSILTSCQNPQVRQYAAVLLRRRLMKSRHWRAVSEDIRLNIRQNVLQVLIQEQEKTVEKAVAQIVGTVAKHELARGNWPELFIFIEQYSRSEEPKERELAFYILCTVSSVATDQLQPYLPAVLSLCSSALQDGCSRLAPLYAINTLTCMAPMVGTDEAKTVQGLIPVVIGVIRNYVTLDEDQACEAFELFDELVESEVGILVPHIKLVIQFCLEIASNKQYGHNLRVKALSFVSWLTRLKRKTILKLKLTSSVLKILFPILCEPLTEQEEEEEYEEAEAHTASSYAAQVIDVMALNLPPEKFIPPLMALVEPGLKSDDDNERRGSYMAIAVAAEGCADHIRNKYLQVLLQCVCKGVSDSSTQVRNAALFALGQFSEHLQPDISKYSNELLPLLFGYLSEATKDADKDPRSITKSYYALEMFCENLGKDILPYLPRLMEHLVTVLSTSSTSRCKELAISAIGATASAAQEDIVPYFPQIIEHLKVFLAPMGDEDKLKLQIQSIDTLGVLARTIGKENFLPLAGECMQLGMRLLADANDPDLRRSIYGMCAAISTLVTQDMAVYMPDLVRHMINSAKSTEGVTVDYGEAETQMFRIFDDECLEEDLEMDDEEEDDDEVEGYNVENAYLEEKEDACCALGELALHTGDAFLPYMDESFREVYRLLEYPSTNVRKAAIIAAGQHCTALADVAQKNSSIETHAALQSMLTSTVTHLLRSIQEDTDRQVPMTALEVIKEMLEKIGRPVLEAPPQGQGDGMAALDHMLACIRDVLQHKTACQDQADGSDPELDDQNAEYDSILVENAGEVIPVIAKVVKGPTFAPYFAGLLPEFMKRLKVTSAVSDKSFAVGTLAETLQAMEGSAATFVQPLHPVVVKMMSDQDEEVRSNSVFMMGVLAANGGDALLQNYPQILKDLFDLMNQEKDRRVIDNVCAAVCRMIWTSPSHVPMEQVFPVIVQCLPLQEDLEENATVYQCIAELYRNEHQVVMKYLPQILGIFGQVVNTEAISADIQNLLVQLVQNIHQRFPEVAHQAFQTLPPEVAANLTTCISSCKGS